MLHNFIFLHFVLSLSFVLSCLPYFSYASVASRKHVLLLSHNPCILFCGITSNHKINSETTLRDPYYNCCFRLGHYLSWSNNIGSLKTQINISLIIRNIDNRYLKKKHEPALYAVFFPCNRSSKWNIEQKVIMVVCNVKSILWLKINGWQFWFAPTQHSVLS